jgi:hypothetical protein
LASLVRDTTSQTCTWAASDDSQVSLSTASNCPSGEKRTQRRG